MFNSFNRYDDTVKSVNRNFDGEHQSLTGGKGKNRLKNFFYILPLIFLILALLFAAIMLHYHHKHSDEIGEAKDSMVYLTKNLKYHPIEDIKAVAKTGNCPTGYHHEHLGKFKGVEHGCLCTDGTTHTKAYCLTKPDTKCKYTSGVKPHDYGNFLDTKICAKRYAKWHASHKSKACTADYKKCQTTVCVPHAAHCPISTFAVASGAASGDTQKAFGAHHHFTAGKATTAAPIVEFEASVSKAPCAANTLKNNQIHSKKVYPLDEVKHSGCGKYGSIAGFSKKAAEEPLQNFYKGNGLDSATKNLPFHNQYYTASDKAELYAVDRAPIKDTKECANVQPDKIHGLVSTIEEQNHEIYVISIIIIVLACLGILLSILFLLFRHKIAFLNSTKGLFLIIGLAVLVAILGIILFALYQHAENSQDVEGAHEHFENLNKHKCLEATPGFHKAAHDITSYSNTVKKNVGYLIIALFVASLVFLVLLAIAIGVRKSQKMSPVPDPSV